MQCQHLTKTERPCKNTVIGNSDYCYLKSHHNTANEFNIVKQKLLDKFKFEHEDPEKFMILDVDGDGACLYRSFAQAVYTKLQVLHDHPLFQTISDIVEGENDQFLDYNAETELAMFLQELIKNWLCDQQDRIVKPLGCKVKDLVETTHEMSMTIYRIIYGIFAGKPDFLMVQKDGIHTVKKIPFRWGGTAEQYAFSIIFDFSINIYDLITLDRRKFTIKPANFRHKIKRLRLLQSFNGKSKNNVHFYYAEIKGIPHYMYLHSE